MKVDNLSYSQLYKSKHGSVYDLRDKSTRANLCENENEKLNKGYYSSGSSVNFGSAAKHSDRILKKLIDGCNDHTVIIQNLWALGLAILPRPIAIMLLPDPKRKNNKDKMAAACHGIASGLVGFAFASAIMYPLDQAAKKIKEGYFQKQKDGDKKFIEGDAKIIQKKFSQITDEMIAKGEVTKKKLLEGTTIVNEKFLDLFGEFEKETGKLLKRNKNLNFDRVTKALDMGPDTFVFGIAKAMLTIALIPPIMKFLFGDSKQKAEQQPKVEGGQK